MSPNPLNNDYKKFLMAAIGGFAAILGVTLILAWWPDVVSLFRGGVGIILAVGGLLAIYSLNLK